MSAKRQKKLRHTQNHNMFFGVFGGYFLGFGAKIVKKIIYRKKKVIKNDAEINFPKKKSQKIW